VDGNGAWCIHSGHLITNFRSFIISIENPHGWNWVFPSQCWVECWMEQGHIRRNLVICNHFFCDYMQLCVGCGYI